MNQEHPGESQYAPDIDVMIDRIKEIDDDNYAKQTGPWSDVFPNPRPAPQSWPEGTDKPNPKNQFDKVHLSPDYKSPFDDKNHTSSVKESTRYVTCDDCDKAELLMDWEGGTAANPHYNRLLSEGGWMQIGSADICNDCKHKYCPECGDTSYNQDGGKCGKYGQCDSFEDSNKAIEKDYSDSWKESSVKISSGQPFTCPHCNRDQSSSHAIDYALEYNECPDCGGYVDNEGPGGTPYMDSYTPEKRGRPFTCPNCLLNHKSPEAIDHAYNYNECPNCGSYVDNEGEGGEELTNAYQNSWKEAAKPFIMTVCDVCGIRKSFDMNNMDDWVSRHNQEYCPDCIKSPCYSCGCERDDAQIEHLTNCRRYAKDGNCSCPPCSCDCHE